MIKRIPQSDIRIRPFKVYKEFRLTQSDLSTGSLSGHQKLLAKKNEWDGDVLTPSASLWASINRLYYDDIYNPMVTYGTIHKNRSESPLLEFRQLKDNAIVFSIPQIKFGERIKPGSVNLYDVDRGNTYLDLYGDGQLYSDIVNTEFTVLNAETDEFILVDAALVEYNLTLNSFNSDTGILNVVYNGIPGILKLKYINANTGGLVIFDVTTYTFDFIEGFSVAPNGNVFYEHGIVVISDIEDLNTDFTNYKLDYKSTKTIFENEYFLSVEPDEFNVSTNPTAYYEVGAETGSIEISATGKTRTWKNPGQRWIRQSGSLTDGTTFDYRMTSSYDGITLAGFNDFEYSSSVDPTGSYLAPYVTTIGLYDENYDMIAVAKLPTPIKIYPDFPVNFLVRIDT